MNFLDLVKAKRDGREHTRQEIDFIIDKVMEASVDEKQVVAWLMAVCCKGMTVDETTALTWAMARSGTMLDFSGQQRPVVDKHSTGGVGDKTTLILVPLLAACGVLVPKLSGRALEHTGGTLDKLESIPGCGVDLTMDQFTRQVNACGGAIASPTRDIVPADAKLYALRNATATVDSVFLGTGSVMSKKIAGGANFILLDVKTGNGAFMDTLARARAIARMMIAVGQRLGRTTKAVITNMNQPLGHAVGNALEITEVIEILNGAGPADLRKLCLFLGSLTLVEVGLAADAAKGQKLLQTALNSGAALDKFKQLVSAQGGDERAIDRPSLLPQSKVVLPIVWQSASGWVQAIDTKKVALAAKQLASGVDGAAANGVIFKPKVGARIDKGDVVAVVHGSSQQDCDAAVQQLAASVSASSSSVRRPQLIIEVLKQ